MITHIQPPLAAWTRAVDLDKRLASTLDADIGADQTVTFTTPPTIPGGNAARWFNITMFSKCMGRNVGYCVYLPASYATSTTTYPVVWMLHGLSVGNEGAFISWLPAVADAAVSGSVCREHIIVFPSGFNSSMWGNDNRGYVLADANFLEVMADVRNRYRVSKRREDSVLCGFSMGGFGALKFALKYRHLFAGANAYGAPMYDGALDPVTGGTSTGLTNAGDIHDWYWYHFSDSTDSGHTRYEQNSPHWWVTRGDSTFPKPRIRAYWSNGDTLTYPTKVTAATTLITNLTNAGFTVDSGTFTGANWNSVANPTHNAQLYFGYDTINPSGINKAFEFFESVWQGV